MIPSKPFQHGGRICGISCAAAVLIAFTPVFAGAGEPTATQPGSVSQGEFIEFLEYLGSWNGQEDQWEQFLSDAGEATTPEELMVDAGYVDAASAGIP
jgi:hypothetical protein